MVCGPSGGVWNENYFRLRETIILENGRFSVIVQPYSMITVTTLETQRGEFKMSTFKNYKRTLSTGSAGASVSVDFDGTGILICGASKSTPAVDILLDGDTIGTDLVLPQTDFRTASYALYGLDAGHHTLTVNIKDKELSIDSFEILQARSHVL